MLGFLFISSLLLYWIYQIIKNIKYFNLFYWNILYSLEKILESRVLEYFYQKPNDTALSIGKQAPIPNQTAKMNPIINNRLAIGRRKGFWNLFTFSMNGWGKWAKELIFKGLTPYLLPPDLRDTFFNVTNMPSFLFARFNFFVTCKPLRAGGHHSPMYFYFWGMQHVLYSLCQPICG